MWVVLLVWVFSSFTFTNDWCFAVGLVGPGG